MKKITISACLIIKNEEENLDKCLKSLIQNVDDIIIVDTGSTDKSKEIASKYTNNVYDFEWVDDFSAARNYSLSKANSDYILTIDADEVLQNGEIIKEFLLNQNEQYGGWLVNLDSVNESNGASHKYTTQLLRMFKNDKDFKFEGIIHEQILNSITKKGYKIGNSDIFITHGGYNLEKNKMEEKQLRNLKLLEKHVSINPNDGYNLFNLAKTYFALNDRDKAIQYFELSLEKNSKDGIIYPSSLNYYAVLLFQMKDFYRAKELVEESLKINPEQAFANYILGDIYFELKDHKESLDCYLKLENSIRNPSNFSKIIGDYHPPLSQVYFRIGRANINLNLLKEALEYFLNGLNENNKDRNCIFGLIEAYHNINDIDNFNKYIQLAKDYFPNDEVVKGLRMKDEKGNTTLNSVEKLKEKLNKNKDKIKSKKINEKKVVLITLSMIVKNEEKMLPGCLESVKNIVDEIVIVDTGSSDKTKEIAMNYGAKLFDFKWVDDFAVARNESLKHCNGKWILYLDADERIDTSNLDINKLRTDLENAEDNLGGIIITIESDHSNMDGSSEKHRGGYPRLFKNLGYPKIYFKGRVHEQITPSLMENNLGLMKSDIKIIHEGYNIPEEQMQAKLKRNYTLLLKHVQEEPLNGYAWYQLGQTLGRMQLLKESQDAIEMAIKCDNLSDSVYASASSTLSQYAGNRKDYKNALYWAEESLKKAPNQIYGLSLKGYSLIELDRKDEAKEVFEKAHSLWRNNNNSVPQSGFDIMVNENVILNGLKKSQS